MRTAHQVLPLLEFVDFAEGYSQLFGDNQTGETGDAQRQAQRPKRSSFFLSCCSVWEAPMLNDTLKLLITSMLVLCFGLSSAGVEGTWFDPLERDSTIRLTGGAFKPDIDSQFDSSTAPQELPYESFFGTEKPLMFTIGIERFLSNLGGGLSIGMTLGYWNVAGAMKSPDSSRVPAMRPS